MQTQNEQIIWIVISSSIIILTLTTLIVTLLFLNKKKKQVYQQTVKNMELNFERNILKVQVEIQEDTFANISKEIHDNINLSLTLAKLHLNTIDWEDDAVVKDKVISSRDILTKAITNLSDLSRSMNPEVIRSTGFLNAVEDEVNRFKKATRIHVDYQVNGSEVFMESEKELIAFRIIQEAFNNILKHAKATVVQLYLTYLQAGLEVRIKDNGAGFSLDEVKKRKGAIKAGLINMETRARLFGGIFQIESSPTEGTQIFVSIPY